MSTARVLVCQQYCKSLPKIFKQPVDDSNKSLKAECKQLNRNKQLATAAIKMEVVQDLISKEKAIIINPFFNAMERSDANLESYIEDIRVKYEESKDKYHKLKATNGKESQSKKV